MNLELLTELCETPGPSGREEPIRQVVRRELEPLAGEVSVDPLGNLVALRPGRGGPRLMLSAHMDEIGFMGSKPIHLMSDADKGRAPKLEDKPHERITALGAGAAVKIYDAGTIVPRRMVEHLVAVAEERAIPHQIEVLPRGSTDTRELALSGDGAAAGCVSIPTRYIHQVVETCHPGDIDACVGLVTAFCETAQALVE